MVGRGFEKRLKGILRKPIKTALGIMSGTSADGVDVALAEISGRGSAVRLRAFATYPYKRELQRRIWRLFSARAAEICEMNFLLGEEFAACALKLLREKGISPQQVDFIGSHGQTVYHRSGGGGGIHSTLQIGEGAVIAARTGILTVCDFRPADVAGGGNGAPLVPLADFLLFRRRGKVRALQNIGGIGNVTIVGEKLADVLAFDTGPGNMILDGLVQIRSRGRRKWDDGGRIASRGKVHDLLLRELMSHPFLSRRPPKSTGREVFGQNFVRELWRRNRSLPFADLLATATYFTALSIHRSYRRFVFPRFRPDEVLVSGGGALNLTLMSHLRDLFQPIPLRPLDELGIEGKAKEALAFAILANETLHGRPGNVPSATGAGRAMILGKIIP